MVETKRRATREDSTKLAKLVLRMVKSAPRCEWGYDRESGSEEPGETRCTRIATHQVEGPHDMNYGEYCKAHGERTIREHCTPPHRFHLNERADRKVFAQAQIVARRVLRG